MTSTERLPRAFYHPTKKKQVKKQVCVSPERLKHKHGQENPTSNKEWFWNLGTATDLIEDTSSKFDESWATQDKSKDTDVTGTTGLHSLQQRKQAGVTDRGDEKSTLARYVERFRSAPPTARDERTRSKPDEFWWTKDGSRHAPSDLTNERLKRLSEDKNKLLETIEGSLNSTDPIVSTDGLGSTTSSQPQSAPDEPAYRPRFTRSNPTTVLRPTCPEDDILVQWRRRRKLEEMKLKSGGYGGLTPSVRGVTAGAPSKVDKYATSWTADDKLSDKLANLRQRLRHLYEEPTNQNESTNFKVTEGNDAIGQGKGVSQPQGVADNVIGQERSVSQSLGVKQGVSVASPCLHPATVPPHHHLTCDILPCPVHHLHPQHEGHTQHVYPSTHTYTVGGAQLPGQSPIALPSHHPLSPYANVPHVQSPPTGPWGYDDGPVRGPGPCRPVGSQDVTVCTVASTTQPHSTHTNQSMQSLQPQTERHGKLHELKHVQGHSGVTQHHTQSQQGHGTYPTNNGEEYKGEVRLEYGRKYGNSKDIRNPVDSRQGQKVQEGRHRSQGQEDVEQGQQLMSANHTRRKNIANNPDDSFEILKVKHLHQLAQEEQQRKRVEEDIPDDVPVSDRDPPKRDHTRSKVQRPTKTSASRLKPVSKVGHEDDDNRRAEARARPGLRGKSVCGSSDSFTDVTQMTVDSSVDLFPATHKSRSKSGIAGKESHPPQPPTTSVSPPANQRHAGHSTGHMMQKQGHTGQPWKEDCEKKRIKKKSKGRSRQGRSEIQDTISQVVSDRMMGSTESSFDVSSDYPPPYVGRGGHVLHPWPSVDSATHTKHAQSSTDAVSHTSVGADASVEVLEDGGDGGDAEVEELPSVQELEAALCSDEDEFTEDEILQTLRAQRKFYLKRLSEIDKLLKPPGTIQVSNKYLQPTGSESHEQLVLEHTQTGSQNGEQQTSA